MADDSLSPKSRQAMNLVQEALYCTEELQADPGKRAAGLGGVLVHELARIPSDDDRDAAVETVVDDIRRLVPVSVAKLAEASKPATVN